MICFHMKKYCPLHMTSFLSLSSLLLFVKWCGTHGSVVSPKEKVRALCKQFFLYEPYLYCSCAYGIILLCVPKVYMLSVLEACHSSPVGGRHSVVWTAHKCSHCGYYWTTMYQDSPDFSKSCDCCQTKGGISNRQELPINSIMVI